MQSRGFLLIIYSIYVTVYPLSMPINTLGITPERQVSQLWYCLIYSLLY